MSTPDTLPPVGAPATEPAHGPWVDDDTGVPTGRVRAQGRETTTAEEEIQRFKRVPVMGRLPWRRQYLVATIGLVLGILVMIQQAVSQAHVDEVAAQHMSAALALRQALHTLDAQAQASRTLAGVDPAALTAARNAGSAGVHALNEPGLVQPWAKLQQAAQALPDQSRPAQGVAQLANQIQTTLAPLGRITPSQDAASVAQDLADWQADTQALAQAGQALGVGLPAARAQIEAQLRAFYASPGAQVNDARKQVWDSYLAAYNQTHDAMDRLLANGKLWQQAAQAGARLSQPVSEVSAQLDAIGAQWSAQAHHSRAGVWLAGLFSALCLGLLTFISTKQQQLAVLEARASSERLEGNMFDLIQQQGQIAQGNLTVQSRVADATVGPLAEGINQTVQQLRTMVKNVRTTVDKTTAVAQVALRANTELAEDNRQQALTMSTNAQDVLKLSQALQSMAQAGSQARDLAYQTVQATDAGGQTVEQANAALRDTRGRNEEALSRIRRVIEATREALVLAHLALDQAESMKTMALQGELRATHAGEAGRGFSVVATNMRQLAGQVHEGAQRVRALIETTQADLEGSVTAIRSSTEQTDESARLNDLVYESWSALGALHQGLKEHVVTLAELAHDQEPVAKGLEHRTREGLELGQRTHQHAHEAAESLNQLTEVLHELGEGAKRFQV